MPSAAEWGVATAVACPHFLYAAIWFYPHKWRQITGKKAVEAFETTAWLMKVVQFGSVISHLYAQPGWPTSLADLDLPRCFIAAALIAAGQALNIGIFKAIGHAGVYYGFKLGHHIPWHEGFPFNVVSHPQYVGSVLTVWGCLLPLLPLIPETLTLGLFWSALYLVTALQEQYC